MSDDRKTYQAVAVWEEGAFTGYAVKIEGLPKGSTGVTQGRTWDEALSMTREVIALLLEVDEDSFDVELKEGK